MLQPISSTSLSSRSGQPFVGPEYLIEGVCPLDGHDPRSGTDDSHMEHLLVEDEATPDEIWVLRVRRRWVVRVDDEDIKIEGGKSDATDRALSIAQLGEGPRDVVIFGRDGSIEERRSFD